MISTRPTLRWTGFTDEVDQVLISRHLLQGNNSAHDHDFMELAVVLNGEAIHLSSQGRTPIKAGAVMLLRPGTWHAYQECKGLEVMNFCFPQSLARSQSQSLFSEKIRSILRSGEGLQITTFSAKAIEWLRLGEMLDREATGSLGLMIWTLDQFASTTTVRPSLHPMVEKAVCTLEERLEVGWTAEQLAKLVGLDKAYLSRLFRIQVGRGPMSYLALLRAERAAAILRSTEMNCGDVGYSVGYQDANLFSRRFRAHHGVSPSEYRNRTRRDAEDSSMRS